MVGEDERGRARAAFTAIDRHEVDSPLRRIHLISETRPKGRVAHSRFDTHGKPGSIRELFDEVEQLVLVAESRVERGTHAVLPHRDPANRRDLRRHLRGRKNPAHPGLRALTELDLDRTYVVAVHSLAETRHVETAIRRAAAEIARPDLPDESAAVIVIGRDPAFSRVVQATRERRATVHRADGPRAQRAETHSRNVDDRVGSKGLRPPASAAEDFGRRQCIGLRIGIVPSPR